MRWEKFSRKRVTTIIKMEINMKGSNGINHKNERSYKNDSHHMNSSNNWKNINRDEQNLNNRSDKNSNPRKLIMMVRIEGMERSKNEYQCNDRKSEVIREKMT